MHDQFLTTMCRKSRHAFEERHRDFRRRVKKGVETLLSAFRYSAPAGQPYSSGIMAASIGQSTNKFIGISSLLVDLTEIRRRKRPAKIA
jgi:hypothetical protein